MEGRWAREHRHGPAAVLVEAPGSSHAGTRAWDQARARQLALGWVAGKQAGTQAGSACSRWGAQAGGTASAADASCLRPLSDPRVAALPWPPGQGTDAIRS